MKIRHFLLFSVIMIKNITDTIIIVHSHLICCKYTTTFFLVDWTSSAQCCTECSDQYSSEVHTQLHSTELSTSFCGAASFRSLSIQEPMVVLFHNSGLKRHFVIPPLFKRIQFMFWLKLLKN